MAIGRTCETCGWIHSSESVVANGRFNPEGVTGYRAVFAPDKPLRDTREAAMADNCAAHAAKRTTP